MTVAARGVLGLLLMVGVSSVAFAHPGIGIVVDRRGNVFYTDLTQVWRISPDGKKTVAVPNVHTHELGIDANGNLRGEHLWNVGERWFQYTWQLSPDGALTKSATRDGFPQDSSFVFDSAGNRYWFKPGPPPAFMKQGTDGRSVAMGGRATYRRVQWLTASARGDVYFMDDGDLRQMTPEGSVATLASRVRERDGWVGGVWLDQGGRIYVALWGEKAVKRFDPATKQISITARSTPPWAPSGGTFAPTGDLWLLETSETNAVRVRRIMPDGSERIY